jgi:D-alanyl-D-alanine carboxypeptidase
VRCRFAPLTAAVVVATVVAACSSPAPRPDTAETACGASFSSRIEAELQNVATVMRRTYQIPGVAVAVTVPGEGCWVSASGVVDTVGSVQLKLGDEFPIASITKTFTATVILQLVQEGKLSLSAPVSRWVPYVQDARRITVKMLLNMTSGIYDEGGLGSQLAQDLAANPDRTYSPQQIVRLAVAHGPAGPPGTYDYSNTNYIILGMIAQAVTGEPIQQLITSRILRPLHLNRTSFPTAVAPPALIVQGYDIIQGGHVVLAQGDSPGWISSLGAAGAMNSTVGDLQIWARALATGTLLSPAMQRQRLSLGPVRAAWLPLPGTPVSALLPFQYGLGIFSLGGLLGHDGSAPGYTSGMFYLPARKATIIILANGDNTDFDAATGWDQRVTDAAAVSIAQIVLPGALTTLN